MLCVHRWSVLILTMCMSVVAGAAELTEPLPVRNLYPPMMRFYDPTPDSALRAYRQAWSFELNQHYATINLQERANNPQLLVDMELAVLDPVMRYAPAAWLELSLRMPLLMPSSGVFDSAIQRFHGWFNMPNGGRELRPNNRLSYRFDNGRGERWQGSNRWQAGNAELSGRVKLAAGRHWALAGLAAVKLPTASQSRGWSSGAADLAAGALISAQRGAWFAHLEGWMVQPLARDVPGIHYRAYPRGSIAAGYQLFEHAALVVQLQGGNSPYRSQLRTLDHPPFLVAFGLHGELRDETRWTLSVVENITQSTTQDISLMAGLRWSVD